MRRERRRQAAEFESQTRANARVKHAVRLAKPQIARYEPLTAPAAKPKTPLSGDQTPAPTPEKEDRIAA
jgi:hypothetical protein